MKTADASPGGRGIRSAWIPAVAAGIAGVILMALLFRSPAPPPHAPPAPPKPAVRVVPGADAAMRDEAILFDLAPLFLPTKWNSTQKESPRQEPGSLDPYPPKYAFGENELRLPARAAAVPTTPIQALAAEPGGNSFPGFGRIPRAILPLAARGGFVEVFAANDGKRVLAMALRDANPPAPSAGWWQAPEFFAAVDPSGLVGSLVLTAGSGSGEIDEYYRNYLTEDFRLGDRLRPGFYRVSAGF